MEKQILGATLRSKRAYDLVRETGFHRQLSEPSKQVFILAGEYYDRDSSAEACDKDIILSQVKRRFEKHEDLFVTVVNEAFNNPVSLDNLEHELVEASLENVRTQLSIAFTRGDDSQIDLLLEHYTRLREKGLDLDDEDEKTLIGGSEALLKQYFRQEHNFPLYPKRLSDHLGGGLVPQSHIVLFARPEAGKSTFALNIAKGWTQAGIKVFYYQNEDPQSKYNVRAIQCYSRGNLDSVRKNESAAYRYAISQGLDNLIIHEADPGSITQLNRLVRKYKPGAVIVDQVRNLASKQESKTLQLEEACQGVRLLGKRFNCVTLSITQAGDSAEGKLHLEMGDIEWSNTGVQGTADLMIGMGVNEDFERKRSRMLTFPKNKINGNKERFRLGMSVKTCQVD